MSDILWMGKKVNAKLVGGSFENIRLKEQARTFSRTANKSSRAIVLSLRKTDCE